MPEIAFPWPHYRAVRQSRSIEQGETCWRTNGLDGGSSGCSRVGNDVRALALEVGLRPVVECARARRGREENGRGEVDGARFKVTECRKRLKRSIRKVVRKASLDQPQTREEGKVRERGEVAESRVR